MTALPNGDQAIIDPRKIEDYCLNPDHPRGRHKARVFRARLGVEKADADWLRSVLAAMARSSSAVLMRDDEFGTQWRIDAPVTRGARSAIVRSIWIVRAGESQPRFVTCWVD